MQQLRGIRHESLVVLVNGCDGEDGILADVGVAVLETGSRRGQQWFYQLSVTELAEKAQGVSPNILVGVLEIHANAVAGECC